ncbi:MAG TPA: (d)CMP kinase [Verrucomicrobiales bacterium]|nr:(d)CMP kinase [Verrucomicrobiales bacterium]
MDDKETEAAGERHRVIAMDGPAASGKSVVGRRAAERLRILFVSSGEMYRAAAWRAARAGIPWDVEAEVVACVRSADLRLEQRDGWIRLLVDGQDPGEELHSAEVNRGVSQVAKMPGIREILLGLQRSCARWGDLLMEGRDIGSVVFPETPYKFYLDASESERARRREAQGQEDAVGERDRMDSERSVAPLCVAAGAIVIDTTSMSIEEVLDELVRRLRQQGFTSA